MTSNRLVTSGDFAVFYAKNGWAVLPLWGLCLATGVCNCPKGENCDDKPGKHPLGDLVPHGVKQATTDLATIRGWFRRYPDANVGIANLLVLDVDLDAIECWQSLQDQHGDHGAALVARSGSGGSHFYYAGVPGIRFKNATAIQVDDKSIKGLDVRAESGYVVAPPSWNAQGQYTFVDVFLEDGDPLPELRPPPDWLVELLPTKGEPAVLPDQRKPSDGLLDVARLACALALLDAGCGYHEWVETGMALHHASGGSAEALELFDAWSATSAKYEAGEPAAKWRSYHADRADPVTEASIYKRAIAAGWSDALVPMAIGLLAGVGNDFAAFFRKFSAMAEPFRANTSGSPSPSRNGSAGEQEEPEAGEAPTPQSNSRMVDLNRLSPADLRREANRKVSEETQKRKSGRGGGKSKSAKDNAVLIAEAKASPLPTLSRILGVPVERVVIYGQLTVIVELHLSVESGTARVQLQGASALRPQRLADALLEQAGVVVADRVLTENLTAIRVAVSEAAERKEQRIDDESMRAKLLLFVTAGRIYKGDDEHHGWAAGARAEDPFLKGDGWLYFDREGFNKWHGQKFGLLFHDKELRMLLRQIGAEHSAQVWIPKTQKKPESNLRFSRVPETILEGETRG